MAVADRVLTYSAYLFQSNLVNYGRVIRLRLESGGTASILFPETRPTQWLQFLSGNDVNLYMVRDQFTDVYHLLQTEKPVFFTALDFEGIQVGGVHTEFDLSAGEPTGEGDADQSLGSVVRRAHAAQAKHATKRTSRLKKRRKS